MAPIYSHASQGSSDRWQAMLHYVTKRLLSTIPVLFGISLLLFFMLRALPGDPAQVLAGQMATPEDIELIRHQLGLEASDVLPAEPPVR